MIHRIDVAVVQGSSDPHARAAETSLRQLAGDGGSVRTWRIFLIEVEKGLSAGELDRLRTELLADPIVESAELMTVQSLEARSGGLEDGRANIVEVHLKPGVMDPVAASAESALREMGVQVLAVRTGRAYRFDRALPPDELHSLAARALANEVIESIHVGEPYLPAEFAAPHSYQLKLRHVALRDLDDDALRHLSRDGHLFLSLAEMQAVQNYFREQNREPTDVELETIAQTWSEHCVHKTLKSAVEVCDESGRVLHTYDNLIKETIFKATEELVGSGQWAVGRQQHVGSSTAHRPPPTAHSAFCLSVFKDNAGVIAFDETDAVCFKVETHNHPSAIEPYGGAATGVGGVIRDILGTGLGARPIANTDVFCVAYPDRVERDEETQRRRDEVEGADTGSTSSLRLSVSPSLPKNVIHPRRTLQRVVAGVRDYGNRMGIPTVNGAVYFDDRFVGNPLVFCGCVGLIPRDKIEKHVNAGDAIVVLGGRTGRDGIHGATFSSAELTDTHADEFSHAVQIGNAITEKKLADVVIAARDANLFSAITDCGAGGLSSAIGEMGAEVGAHVELEKVPLKYAGLRYDEIWISEAQERMVVSVPPAKIDAILKLAAGEDVEATVIGRFGTDNAELVLNYNSTEVGRMSMAFLHDGIPMPKRRAVISSPAVPTRPSSPKSTGSSARDGRTTESKRDRLLANLAHPNIASKHWLIRQYDHEVQSGSVIKPLIGPKQNGPSDAAVLRPKLDGFRGVVVACGLAPHIADPYAMAIASIDEAVRNAVAVGANLDKLAMLDNFCWPSCDDERAMGALVRACEACCDAAIAYGIPFISGKDSLNNQFTNSETGEVIRIPHTLLISTIGVIDDVRRCVTSDLKSPGNSLYLVRPRRADDLSSLPSVHRLVAGAIERGLVRACHDVSDGGILTAAAEMCIGGQLGLSLLDTRDRDENWLFEEMLASYLVEIPRQRFAEATNWFTTSDHAHAADFLALGEVIAPPRLAIQTRRAEIEMDEEIATLEKAWLAPLDW